MINLHSHPSHLVDLNERFQKEAFHNCPEYTDSITLQFNEPPSINCSLHGSLFFLTPGVIKVDDKIRCGNLDDAIPMLHCLQIDHDPGAEETSLIYSSRYSCPEIISDLLQTGTSNVLHNTSWNLPMNPWRLIKKHTGTTFLCNSAILPSIPFGSLLDTQHQVSLMRHGCSNLLAIQTDTLQPTSGPINLNALVHQPGELCGRPIFQAGKMTLLFKETLKNEARYHVVEYGPGPDPQHLRIAVFMGPNDKKVKCFVRLNDKIIVVIPSKDKLLFHILTEKIGLTAVYQADFQYLERVVNVFEGGGDLFVDCVLFHSDPKESYNLDRLQKDRYPLEGLSPRLCRYSLLDVNVEEARFDGAAGQLERYPVASCHYLGEQNIDENAMVTPRCNNVPYRYCYSRCLSKNVNSAVYYNAICKMDTIDRGKKGEEWHGYGCFPSPCTVIQQSTSEGPRLLELASPPSSPTIQQMYLVRHNQSTLKSRSDSVVSSARSQSRVFYSYEDDVLVVSMVRDVSANTSFILFLDGHDMTESARIILPTPVAPGNVAPLWLPRDASSDTPPAVAN